MSSFNSGTGKIDFFDCSSTDESKRATLSVRIKRLVDMGLIERKLNEDDKRHYYIVLSSQGEAVIDEMKKDFHHVHQIVCKGMTDEDYMAVLNVVKKIKRNLKEEIK